jgi:predicted MFS family arabinose efflux permease
VSSPTLRTWLAVGSIAVGAFAMVTTEFLPVGLLTDIARSLQVSDGIAGLMVTIPGAVAAVAALLSVVVAGRMDRRVVLMTLVTLLIGSNIVAALAPDFVTLLIGRMLLGVCVGAFWSFAPSVARQMVPPASQGRAMSLVLTGVSIGTVCGVPAGALISELAGWRMAFAATGVLTALVLITQYFLLPSVPAPHSTSLRQLFAPLKIRLVVVGLVASVTMFGGHFAAYTYLRPLLEQVFKLSPGLSTTLLFAYGISGVFGTFAGEAMARHSLHKAFVVTPIVLAAAVLLAAFGGGAGSNTLMASTVVIVWGVAFGAVPVCITAWMFEAAPKAQETAQALLVCIIQVAISLGAFIGGRVVDDFGVPSTMAMGGIVALLTAVVIGVVGRARSEDRQATA